MAKLPQPGTILYTTWITRIDQKEAIIKLLLGASGVRRKNSPIHKILVTKTIDYWNKKNHEQAGNHRIIPATEGENVLLALSVRFPVFPMCNGR